MAVAIAERKEKENSSLISEKYKIIVKEKN